MPNSSDDLKIFLENFNKLIDKPINILDCDPFMHSVINLIVDGDVDVSDILKVLKRFLPEKDKKSLLELKILLKCCQKIQNDQKWNLRQVKKFLKYGLAKESEESVSYDVNYFFELLIIFVNNADLKNKIDIDYPNKTDNEDNKNIKNDTDMTYEKFVNETLLYAKKLYFKQKNFSWSKHFNHCNNIKKLQKNIS